MLHAVIDENLSIAGYRDVDPSDVPSHKLRSDGGKFLRPVSDPGQPNFNAMLETVAKTVTVETGQVIVSYSISRRSEDEQRRAVKAEAGRRILERFPEWKQANMTARSVELIRKGEQNWTTEEAQEAAAIQSAWDWVKDVQTASDALESAQPIPVDFTDDGYWPSAVGL